MGKLIKYEWKKQRTSRMVISIALLACLCLYAVGELLSKDLLMGTSAFTMICGSFLVVFYVGIESILVLDRDLRTKQSYMLWMVPRSIWEILGAKFVAAILQMFFVFGVYAAAGILCVTGIAAYNGKLGTLLESLYHLSEYMVDGGLTVGKVIWILIWLFLGWTGIIMTGFMADILSRSFLRNSRFAGFVSLILFFVISSAVSRFYTLIASYLSMPIEITGFKDLWPLLFWLIISLIMFGLSGWMAERKLSV